MSDDSFRPDLKDRAREPFRQSNPETFGRSMGNPEVVDRLAAIERRTADIRERVRDHCKKFEETWTAKEAISLWRKRAGLVAQHPSPTGAVNTELAPETLIRDARRRVRARATKRLSELSRIKSTMENAVIRTQQDITREHAPKVARAFENTRRMQRSL